MIQKMLWLAIPLTLWISLKSASSQGLCEGIDKKGVLELKYSESQHLDELCDCTGFKKLVLKKYAFINLPECLSVMDSLRSLSFSKSQIQRLPQGIEKFAFLEELDLSYTNIVFLPDLLVDLYALKTLDLRGTEIASLPEGLDNLEKIDMRMIDLNRSEQDDIREQYPHIKIYFSSPCQCK